MAPAAPVRRVIGARRTVNWYEMGAGAKASTLVRGFEAAKGGPIGIEQRRAIRHDPAYVGSGSNRDRPLRPGRSPMSGMVQERTLVAMDTLSKSQSVMQCTTCNSVGPR